MLIVYAAVYICMPLCCCGTEGSVPGLFPGPPPLARVAAAAAADALAHPRLSCCRRIPIGPCSQQLVLSSCAECPASFCQDSCLSTKSCRASFLGIRS